MLIAIGDLQNRVGALEQGRQTLLDRIANLEQDVLRLYDGTHAYGESSARYRWTPSNNPSNGNTRISFDTVLAQSNMDHPDDYTFSPQFEGDFAIFAYLNFEADSSGDEWRMQAYDNGGAIGRRFNFKPDEIGGGVFAQFFLQTAGFFQAGDAIDLRLWPKDSGKRGWIESFSYQMVGLGLVDPG